MSNDALALIKQYADQQATGNLVLKKFNGEYEDVAYVYLNQGRIYSTLINQEFPPIGARIFSSGLVEPHDFSRAMEEAGGDANDPLVYTTLLREDLFPERTLHSYIKDEFLGAMRVILSWTDVEQEWRAGDSTKAFVVAPITLRAAYEKVNENLDKIAGMMEEIYIMTGEDLDNEELEPEIDAENVVPYPINEPEEGEVSSEESSFFKKIDGKNKIGAICENFGYVTLPALRNAYSLWRKGYVGLHLYGNTAEAYDAEIIAAYDGNQEQAVDSEENTDYHEETVEEETDIPENVEEAPVAFADPVDEESVFIDEEDDNFDQEPTHHAVSFADSDEDDESFTEEESSDTEESVDEEDEEKETPVEEDFSTEEDTPTDDELSVEEETDVEEEATDETSDTSDDELSIEEETDAEEEEADETSDMSEYVNQIMGETSAEETTEEDLEEETAPEPAPLKEKPALDGNDFLASSLNKIEEDLAHINNRLESIGDEKESIVQEVESNETEIESLRSKLAELETLKLTLDERSEAIVQNEQKLLHSRDALTRAYNALVETVS